MRLATPLVSATVLIAATPLLAAPNAPNAPNAPKAPNEIAVSPNPVQPGHPVTLVWYFTGNKVVVSGGRFGKGTVVTGKSRLTDTPAKTTRYTFDVWYTGQKTNVATGKVEMAPLHAQYFAVAEVMAPIPSDLQTYRDARGWQVTILKGWKCDAVSMPDPANNALLYFQPEYDSVERLAVSVVPAPGMSTTDLMSKVQKSLPQSYESVEVLSDKEMTFADVPAVISVFTGGD